MDQALKVALSVQAVLSVFRVVKLRNGKIRLDIAHPCVPVVVHVRVGQILIVLNKQLVVGVGINLFPFSKCFSHIFLSFFPFDKTRLSYPINIKLQNVLKDI